jgi:bacterioferritin-associated ferredoxin
MYVCNCNGIREHQVLKVVEGGARRPCDIFQQHNCKVKCGRCVEEMRAFLVNRQNSLAMAAE